MQNYYINQFVLNHGTIIFNIVDHEELRFFICVTGHTSIYYARGAYMSTMELELAAPGLEVYSQNFSATRLVTMDTKVKL